MFIRTVRIAAQQQKRGGLKIWRCQGVACVKVRHIFSWFFAAFWSSKKQKKLNHSIHVTFFKKKLPKPARHVKAGNKGGKTCQNTCFSAWPRAGRKNCRGDSRSILPGSVTPTVSAKQVTGWLRADPALQTVILSKNQAVAVMTGGFDYVQPPERQEPQPSRREPKPLTEALEGSKGYGCFESLSHLWRPQPPVESFIPILNM